MSSLGDFYFIGKERIIEKFKEKNLHVSFGKITHDISSVRVYKHGTLISKVFLVPSGEVAALSNKFNLLNATNVFMNNKVVEEYPEFFKETVEVKIGRYYYNSLKVFYESTEERFERILNS